MGWRYYARCVVLLLAALVAPVASSQAQGETPHAAEQRIIVDVGSEPATDVEASPQALLPAQTGPIVIYMPSVRTPAIVTPLQFGTGVAPTGEVLDPNTVFPYGVTTLYVSTTIFGGEQSEYRVAWFFDDQAAPTLGDSGMLTQRSQRLTRGFCYSAGSGCDGALQPISRRSVRVQVFLNNQLMAEGSAVIQ